MPKIAGFFFLIILLSSCEGFIFHEEQDEFIVIDTEKEKIEMLNGIYYNLVQVHNRSYFEMMVRADDVNLYTNYNFSYNPQTGIGGCGHSGGSGQIDLSNTKDEIYSNLYKAILNTNHLLGQLDEATDAAIIGEAYFLRAYCYFKLARFFGQIPLVIDIDVSYLLAKPEYSEVYELIESDLLNALELLPENNLDARIPLETPNQGAAKALLAEVYLAMAGFPVNNDSKYLEAARLAGEVIEQAEFYNYALLDDLANLWKEEYRHNTENIFGLFFSGEDEATSNFIGANYISDYNDLYFNVLGLYNPEFKFFNNYPNNYRKYTYFVTGTYVRVGIDTLGGDVQNTLYFKTFDPLVDPCAFIRHGAYSLKWIDIEGTRRENGNARFDRDARKRSKITLYLLRYAQTLLTYAEAKARAGNLDASCYEAVNMIRRRANKVDIYSPSEFDLATGLTTEQFLDSVVWERAWEICSEPEGRWFDILRLDLKDKLPEYRYPIDIPSVINADFITDDWYFYRIPIEEGWNNPNFADHN